MQTAETEANILALPDETLIRIFNTISPKDRRAQLALLVEAFISFFSGSLFYWIKRFVGILNHVTKQHLSFIILITTIYLI